MSKGRRHFILVRGVLVWGLGTATLISAWNLISKGTITREVIMPFIVFPPLGILWGAWTWRFLERRYEKRSAEERSE
jgi:hypothetical protein